MKHGNENGNGRGMSETRVSRGEMEELMRAFSPLVLSLARRYEGRGAEADDLRQEGYLELVRMARSVGRRQFLRVVSRRLPGLVRDAAARMRRPDGAITLTPADGEGDEEWLYLADGRAEADCAEAEFRAALERVLAPRDLAVLEAMIAGESGAKLSRQLGLSRSAFRKRLARVAKVAAAASGAKGDPAV